MHKNKQVWSSAPQVIRIEYKFVESYVNDGKTIDLVGEYLDKNGDIQSLPRLPNKSRQEDAGYDTYSAEDGVIPARGSRNFHTGIRVACPLGWFFSVRGRSGLGFKGVEPFIGTLDATYNGELRILLSNYRDQDFKIYKGDRIAQIVFEKQFEINPVLVNEFSQEYDKRGIKGFGSSGN